VIALLHKEAPAMRPGVSLDPSGRRSGAMTTDAEIDAATEAMRKIRTVGGKNPDDVLRAYARAALEAAERVLIERVRKRTELRQNLSNGSPPPG
jgi:hypothetical protein